MKKLLVLFSGALFFASCNVDLPKEAFLEQMKTQCADGQYKAFIGKDASEASIENFCECYASVFDTDGDTISIKDAMKAAKKESQEKFQQCADDAKQVVEEVAPPEVETNLNEAPQLEIQKKTEQ